MSSKNTPCAACKFLRRKCTQHCIFAPYYPADNPQRFACVHRVYGPSNVGKILNELSASQREDMAKSLAYEAEARLRDPVYGIVGPVYEHQQRLKQLETILDCAKKELSTFGPEAMQDLEIVKAYPDMFRSIEVMPTQYQENNVGFPLYGTSNAVAAPHNQLVIQDAEQQELLEAQQLAAAQQQRELMMRTYEQQQHQPLVSPPHNQRVIQAAEQQELLEAQQLAAAQQQRELMMRTYEQQQHQPLVSPPHNQRVIQDAEQQELLEAQQLAAAQQQQELMMRTYEQQHQLLVVPPHNQFVIEDAEQQELLEAQQLAAAQQQREYMMMSYEQRQQEFMRFGGFEPVGGGGSCGELNQMSGCPAMLALGNFDNVSLDQIQQQQHWEQQHHRPHNHVPRSHPNAIEAQQHHKQGLDNVSLDQIQGSNNGNNNINRDLKIS